MDQKMPGQATPFAQTYFHGTKASLVVGDAVSAGFTSNYGAMKTAKYVFLTATLDAAIWGAELALGDGPERIYLVQPSGEIEDDPDVTDRKFPGNPTKSYRTVHPLLIVGEVIGWRSHPSEQLEMMRSHLRSLREQGVNSTACGRIHIDIHGVGGTPTP